MQSFDAIVIGSGPGGYVCAIRLAQLDKNVAIIERYPTLGGTCLNVGCIPSKALLDSSEHYYKAKKEFATHGIHVDSLGVDMAQMMDRKAGVVKDNVDGIAYLMKKNKITVLHGHGAFVDPHTVEVTPDEGESISVRGEHIIIATGSKPSTPAAFNYDKQRVITSTEALEIRKVPSKLVVIGGGVIGLELGSVYARLGTEVSVIEYEKRITPGMDKDVSRELMKSLKKIGFEFHLAHKVEKVTADETQARVTYSPRDGGEAQEISADYCLISTGRRPYTTGLSLESAGVTVDDRGFIITDGHCRTSVSHIYAIGDVIGGAMLAHKAEDEGVAVAEIIAGQLPHIDYNLIPNVIYTWPEAASVGKTEDELKEAGIPYKKGKFAYRALGRARASMDMDGFVKILAHEDTDEVLGVHIVGARAADMVQEATAVMEFKGAAEDIARICHPHPTYTEAIKEAALDVDKRSIHM